MPRICKNVCSTTDVTRTGCSSRADGSLRPSTEAKLLWPKSTGSRFQLAISTGTGLAKANLTLINPRVPAGQTGGGEWTGSDATAPSPALVHDRGAQTPESSLIGGRWPAPAGDWPNPWLRPAQAEEDENGRDGLLGGDFEDLPREFRQEIYESLRSRVRAIDPRNPALESLTSPNYMPTQADIDNLRAALREAQAHAGEPPATDWELGWGTRGVAMERLRLGGPRTLPSNAPTIDDFRHDVVVSIKSIDLNAPWYQDPPNLSRKIDGYVDKLRAFDAMNWNDIKIRNEEIRGKVLDIVVPKSSGTPAQWEAIAAAMERARRFGVHIFVNPY